MIRFLAFAFPLALCVPSTASAQPVLQSISGTRLDVVATGEVVRTPDIARINAGVVSQAQTASAAIRQNAERMNRVIAALKRAGIAERDIQTSTISLNPEYRYVQDQTPVLTGYRASNEVTIRFRDIAETGSILDALVAQGANQINGPMLSIDKPDEALDEARQQALTKARARADIYAKALGTRVKRILSISESGAAPQPYPIVMERMAMQDSSATSKIVPGEQSLSTTLSVSFELD